jgi:two-component system CitB family sensor kinase
VTTVLGNLIDNAVNAAVAGSSPDRWVELEVLDEPDDDGGTLHIVVADSGDGLGAGTDAEAVFAEGFTTAGTMSGAAATAATAATGSGAPGFSRSSGGQGLGLALARQLARRRGGDVRVLEAGSPGGPGAVFMASLPRTTAGSSTTDRPAAGSRETTGTEHAAAIRDTAGRDNDA